MPRQSTAIVFAGMLAVLALVAVPSPADACSCMPPASTDFLAPADGAVGVPTNARIWAGGMQTGAGGFSGSPRQPIQLLDSTGAVVGGEERDLFGAFELISVFLPDAALAANSTYQVAIDGTVLATFTTGDAPDETPPGVPTTGEQHNFHESGRFSSCGEMHYAMLDVEHDGMLVVMDREEESQLLAEHPSGGCTEVVLGDSALIGSAACQVTWSEASRGARTDVRFGAFDIAGNFSGWSDLERVRLGAESGCTSAKGSTGAAMLVAVLGLLVLGRRRR